MNTIVSEKDYSRIEGKLYCVECKTNTQHHTKPLQSNGKTFCNDCGNMTEYTARTNEGHDL